MKSTKTILAVAILIVGFAYAVGSAHPHFDNSFKHSHRCGPQPGDIRHYFVNCSPCSADTPTVIIPKVEGTNGFIITDFAVATALSNQSGSSVLWLAENDVQLTSASMSTAGLQNFSNNFTSGIPVAIDSSIAIEIPNDMNWLQVTLSGYVY